VSRIRLDHRIAAYVTRARHSQRRSRAPRAEHRRATVKMRRCENQMKEAISVGILLLLLGLSCIALRAQPGLLRFQRLSVEEGLSQTSVRAILQDRRGLMWFATEDGLNRFDGYQCKTYRHDPQNPNTLSQNFIFHMHEDRTGQIWLRTINNF